MQIIKAKHCFNVKDPKCACSINECQMRWFLNLKNNLKTHLKKLQHLQRAAVSDVINIKNDAMSEQINETCSNVLYYIVKTNTAWALFPVLLAVLYRSGHEIGNINHSHYACETITDILNTELISNSKQWFRDEKSMTLTADIGTLLGLSLLVVLLESESSNSVRLAGIRIVR